MRITFVNYIFLEPQLFQNKKKLLLDVIIYIASQVVHLEHLIQIIPETSENCKFDFICFHHLNSKIQIVGFFFCAFKMHVHPIT